MMTTQQLEQRLATLEREMAQIQNLLKVNPPQRWWEKVAGTLADDAAFEEAERLGREWRIAQTDDLAQT